ncbi:MAG: DUF4097 family beta strand repeat-containing protein [Christensenellales bacterium]
MTKNEYLIELAKKLQALHVDTDALYPETRRLVGFYQEMIEDRIEDGLTEAEAVAGMEPVEEIVARVRGEFSTTADDAEGAAPADGAEEPHTTARASGKYTHMTKTFKSADVARITVADMNRALRVYAGDAVAIEYVDGPDGHYEVSLEGGELIVRFQPEFSWLRPFFGIRAPKDTTFKLTVPRDFAGLLDLRTTNGSVTASRITAEGLTLRSSNGKLTAEEIRVSGNLHLKTTNGGVSVRALAAREITCETTNGRLEAEDVAAVGAAVLTTVNGANSARGVAGEGVRIETRNGHLSVAGIRGDAIYLASSNGAITGSVCGKLEDYAVSSRTSNGKSNLPAASEGEKQLEVRTSNARIDISFEG